MIDFISSWARQIIVSVVIAIILEMILSPDSKSTKYIKTVIGIYVVYVIVAPIISLMGGDLVDFSNIDYENYFVNSEIYQSMEESISTVENDNFEETYKLNLKQDIESKLREKGYIVSNIDLEVNLDEDSEEYGMITSVKINLSNKSSEETANDISIEKIEVGISDNQNETSEEENEIRAFVSEEYGVNFDNITIKK